MGQIWFSEAQTQSQARMRTGPLPGGNAGLSRKGCSSLLWKADSVHDGGGWLAIDIIVMSRWCANRKYLNGIEIIFGYHIFA